MAGRGNTIPKPPDQRRRTNETAPWSKLTQDGELRGPALPTDALDEPWHPRTVDWWDTWRRSAQAQQFTETDWNFLLDTALMHHTMWLNKRWEFAGELRLRVGKLGATLEDRLRLRQTIVTGETEDPEAGNEGTVTNIRKTARAGMRIAE